MNTAQKLLASAAVIFPAAMAIAPTVAHATPYAFANNQITGLKFMNADGTPLPPAISAATIISDSAQFGGFGVSGDHNTMPVGSANIIAQAYSGPGPTPPASFNPVGPGNFTGTRSDASVGAGTAATGVAVNNVAEGFGSALGTSMANNNATITFKVTGTGQALVLSFTDAYLLTVSSAANINETATASIGNSFSITQLGSSTPLPGGTYGPQDLNQSISSQIGVPPSNSASATFDGMFTTPILASGQTYVIELTSSSSEGITPGSPTPVPEPASMAILGAGLLGLGLTFRRKRR